MGNESAPPTVQLIFPPLVESNFGSVYPASAVLAAFLRADGVSCDQHDLNEEFADYLLLPDVCEALGAGAVSGVTVDSRHAAMARWASRNRLALIDREGRHHFGPTSRHGWVMELMAQAFAVDSDASILQAVDTADPKVARYLDFYQKSGISERVKGAVLIGITAAMGPQFLPALILAQYLKSAVAGIRVVVGGPAVSLMAEPLLESLLDSHPAVDCVVRYDGEQPLRELAEHALTGTWEPETVAGVSVAGPDGTTHVPPGPGPNLNRLPTPSYSRELLNRLANPTLSVTQARGCYWGKCDYCDFVELYEGSSPFRGRHPENFTEEVARLSEEFGISRFSFITESIPPAFARRMSKLFLEREIKVTWSSFAMVDRRFDREVLDLMVQAGCEFLVIGLETTVTRVLNLVHKSSNREENIRFLKDAHRVGMRLRINLIPDLPSTTYDESLRALEDISELAECVESVSVFPFEATRSSNVGRAPERFGLTTIEESRTVGQAQYALNHLHNRDLAMTPQQRAEIHERYREFSRQVDLRTKKHQNFSGIITSEMLVRVPVDELDVLDLGDQIICTQMSTRQRLIIPPAASPVIRTHLDGQPFSAGSDFTGSQAGRLDVIRQLASLRMLVPARYAEGQDE